MSRTSTFRRRGWRAGASVAAAAAIAAVGLVAAPAANAAAPTVTISPTSAPPSTNTAFTVTVSATATSDAAQTVKITVPAGFTSPSLDPGWTRPEVGWTVSGPVAGVYTFSAPGTNAKLNGNEKLVATISAVTPAAAAQYTWGVSATTNGTTAISGLNQPVVTVGSVKQNQTITFGEIADQAYGTGPLTLGATASSGLSVGYATSGNCSVAGNQLTLGNVGSCSVTASQAGDASWNAATDVTRTFTIVKANQTIDFPAITPPTYGDGPLTLSATATSGLTVSFSSSTTSVCTVSGTQLTLVAAGTCTVTADQAGNTNYNAAPSNPQTFSVLKATATLSLSDLNHTYDASPHGATVTTTPSGLTTVTVTYNGSTTQPTAAGSYSVHASLDNPNYEGEVDGTLVIGQKHVTGSFTVGAKTYNGDTDATIASCSVSGIEAADTDVDIDCGTAAFDGAGAGSHSVSLTGATLTGTGSENYVLDPIAPITASIDQKVVTAQLQAGDKVYDGTDSALGHVTVTLDGVLAGEEDLVDTAVDTATFDDRNVGTGKTVTVTVHLTGSGAGNYVLASGTVTDTASINALHITGSFTAAGKVYDGTTAATVTGRSLTGVLVISGHADDVALSGGTATFADKTAAAGKTVTLTGATLTGTDAGNYVLDSVGTTTADISKRDVSGSFTAADKVWDGTTAATISGRNLAAASGDTGKIAGDDLTLTGGTASFADANVGNGKTVTGSGFSLDGTDAGNYTLVPAQPWTTTASITPLYSGKGFYQPVDMNGVWNTVKGGQTVPLKFEVFNAAGTVEQTSMTVFGPDAASQAAAFTVTKMTCPSSTNVDAIEEVLTTTGGTQFRYDTTGGQYIQNWKTPTTVNTCYKVTVKAVDGTTVGPAYFKITK